MKWSKEYYHVLRNLYLKYNHQLDSYTNYKMLNGYGNIRRFKVHNDTETEYMFGYVFNESQEIWGE